VVVHAITRARSTRGLRGGLALVAASIACLAPVACSDGDPLEAIRRQQASGDIEGSLEPLRELLAERPDDAEAHYLYGRGLVLTQRGNLASWSLRRAMEHPDWLIPAGLQLAQLALANSDFNEVVEIAGSILEREPDNVPALLLRARAYVQWKKHPDWALADADRVLELDPTLLAAYEPRIGALIALDRKDEARVALAEAGRKLEETGAGPGLLAWHCATTAVFQVDAGDVEGGREKWAECIEAYPTDLHVVSGALRFHDVRGEVDRSLELAQAALEQAPDSQPLRTTLANRLVLMGRPAEAEALLREATRSPNPQIAVAAWQELGKLRQSLGEYAAAAEALGQALELVRQEGTAAPHLEFDYADTLVVAGHYARALEVAEELSSPAHQHLVRARVALAQRRPAEALAEFEAGLQLWPDNPYARYYAAVAAEQLGDFDRALAEYRWAVRDSPGATDSRTRGATLLLAEGKPLSAVEFLQAGAGRGSSIEPEGQVLLARAYASTGNRAAARGWLELLQQSGASWIGRAWAAAAEGLANRAGPAAAVELLSGVPAANWKDPRFAPALRSFVRFGHAAGDPAQAQAALRAALAAHPKSGAFQEIRGLDLELSGAEAEAVRAAYTRALELQPNHAPALTGLGRLTLASDPTAAIDYFDRAAAAEPEDPASKLEAARAVAAGGDPAAAAERFDALLLKHPWEGEAAAERARLDLDRGVATPQTLERARRAVRFGGGADALDLLSQVHERLGEPEAAAQAAERARVLRESQTHAELEG
jgi:tetratricopeptide (TPR) repeat protein